MFVHREVSLSFCLQRRRQELGEVHCSVDERPQGVYRGLPLLWAAVEGIC